LSTERVRLFEVQEAHIALLKAAYVGWDDGEFGAPAIDCKRPYGNSSVLKDMREILGWPIDDEEGKDGDQTDIGWSDDKAIEDDDLEKLHKETKVALQIALSVGYFKPGLYTAKEYSKDWEPVKK
jgi:hypothetical protein